MLLLLLSSAALLPQAKPIDMASWFTTADYPAEALRKGIEGAVGYQLDIGSDGKVANCQVTASSGQALLDDPTCELLRQRGHFLPPTDAAGKPVSSSYSGRIRWTLPPPAPPVMTVSGAMAALNRLSPGRAFRLPQPSSFEPSPDPVVDPDATKPPADPRVRFGQLPNGLRYAILANNTPSGAVSLRLRIGAGSADETPAQAGYAHLVEHMIFRGSTNVPEGEFEHSLQQMGLMMGSDTTAFTFPEETVFGLDFPSSHLSNVTQGLFLLREVADRASILPAPLVAERGVVLSELRLRDTAAQRMDNARQNFLLPGEAVARPVGGTPGSVANAGAEALRTFYRDHYRPERSVLIVVGDIAPADVEADIRARFAGWKAAGPPVAVIPRAFHPRASAVRLFIDPGAPKTVRIDWQSPYDGRPDDYVRQAEYVADTIMFEILNDRFLRALSRPATPFSAASAGMTAMFHTTIETSIAVQPVDGKLHLAIASVLAEQRRLIRYGISRPEFDRAVARIRAQLAEGAAAADKRGSSDLADGLLASFDSGSIFVTPRQNEADVDRLIRSIGLVDIDKAAARLFAGSGPLLFVSDTRPPPGGETALRATLARAMAAPVAPQPALTAQIWPYQKFGTTGRIVERKDVPDIGVTMVRFANGTSATIRPTPGTGQVLLDLAFGAGLNGVPSGHDHALWLLNQAPETFVLGGLGKADLADINDALFGKTVGATLSVDVDHFNLMGRTRPDDLEAEAQLLTAYVADPAFRPRALRDAATAQASALNQIAASVPLTAGRDLAFLLHDRDPRWRGAPSADDVRATTTADLPALLGPSLAGPLNLVIVGDVEVERAIHAAQDTVGALPPRGPRPPMRDARFPAAPHEPLIETVHGAANQAVATAAWPTASFTANMADSRATQVMAEVIKARLMAGLRERDGLSYAPEAFVEQSVGQPDYAMIGMRAELPPEKVPNFFAELEAIVRDLAQNPVKAEELARARTPMVDASRRGFGFSDYWADALAASDSNPTYFDMIRSKIPDLERVSPADVQRLAARYFVGREPFRFVVRPAAEPAKVAPMASAAGRGAALPRGRNRPPLIQ